MTRRPALNLSFSIVTTFVTREASSARVVGARYPEHLQKLVSR